MKITLKIPEQSFIIDSEGYGRIKFILDESEEVLEKVEKKRVTKSKKK